MDPELALAARRARTGTVLAARDLRGSLPAVLEEEAALLTALEGASEQPCPMCAPFVFSEVQCGVKVRFWCELFPLALLRGGVRCSGFAYSIQALSIVGKPLVMNQMS